MVPLKGKFMTTVIIDLQKLTNKMKTKKGLTTYRYFFLFKLNGLSKTRDDLKQELAETKANTEYT